MKTSRLLLLPCSLSLLGGYSAHAADSAVALEEIVVTAERREQSLQDIPLSITAFSDEIRERVGIMSIQDMANFAPGVSFNMATDRPSIRGVARQSNFFSLDSPVANYYDGVYTSSVQDAQRRPIFIERTEILRGPQGALSGRGSIAGAFNTISKMPQDVFGAELRAFGGSYSRYGVEGTMTGPLTDWLRARVNLGSYHQDEGYFDNVATGRSEGDQPNNRDISDFLFDVDLGENVDLFLKAAFADYDETRRTGFSTAPFVAGVQGAPTAYGPSAGTVVPLASWGYFDPTAVRLGNAPENPVIATGNTRNFSNDFPSRQKLDNHHNYTAHLTWHAPSVDIKWIGGRQNYRYTQWTDVDGTDVLSMTLPTGRVVSPGGTNMYMEDREWYSNELTFTSTTDAPLQWIFGLYQSNEQYQQEPATTTYPGYEELNNPWGTIDQLLAILGQPFDPNNIRPVVPNPYPNTSVVGILDGETISSAAFGQIDYQLNDRWKFTVGLRYNKDEKEVRESLRYIANGLGNGLGNFLAGGALAPFGIPGIDGPISVDVTPAYDPDAPLPEGVVADHGFDPATGYRVRDLANDWEAVTGSAGVDFTPTEDDLIFLRAARGYRPGGFNAGFYYDPPMVDKETVDSYEVGYKTTLFNRLQLSTSVFYYDYQDIQLPLPTLGRCTDPNDLSTCTTLNSFVNLPKAESKGVEVEANWAATDRLSFYLTYGYLDASIKDAVAPGSNGFSNPDDPAAILPGANPFAPILNPNGASQVDTGFTGLPRFTQDLSGNSLANSPEHRVAFNASYALDFSIGSLVLSSSYIWRDEQYSDVFETEVAKVPSYDTIGVRALWNDIGGRYTFILYGNNLTDEDAADSAGVTRQRTGLTGAAGAAYYRTYNLAPPREWGVEVQYRFGL